MKKTDNPPKGKIKQISEDNPRLRFSFELFDSSDAEICPGTFPDGYTQTLMGRLKDISSMKMKEFINSGKSLRAHMHIWSKTSRPKGYEHLNEQFQAYPGWQFCLTANEHGRVHGLIIGDTFYVIWLDQQHKLYPDA